MFSKFSFVIFLLFSDQLVFASEFSPQLGKLDEVIQAAKDDKEPAYIKKLMESFSEKIWRLAKGKTIGERNKLAFFLTMHGMISAVSTTASNVANEAADMSGFGFRTSRAAKNSAAKNAANVGTKVVFGEVARMCTAEAANAAYFVVMEVFDARLRNLARNLAMNAVRNTLADGTPEQGGRIVYRVVEWVILNHLLEDAVNIFTRTYNTAEWRLPENVQYSPIGSDQALVSVYQTEFASLNADAMVFLAPMLVHLLPTNILSAIHTPIFLPLHWPRQSQILMGSQDQNSVLSSVSRDLIFLILLFHFAVFQEI